MRKIRGGKISVIFQNPTTSLNPSLKIGDQIAEVIGLHQNVRGRSDIRDRTVEILERVGIRDAEERLSSYPYEFSVGMRQRVMIAMALSASPKLVVADEPTSALDVSIQSQILELMRQLEKELQFSMIFITHHLGVAVEMCDRIAIMYAAKVMEYADKVTIFTKPKHPYTFALMKSMPFLHKDLDKLWIIKGDPPDLTGSMNGCRFHPRCFSATEVCKNEAPPLVEHEPNHFFACFHPVA
jgi:peptide/nickel transport system ATP-binding protein